MENLSLLCGGVPRRISSCSTNELSLDSDSEGLGEEKGYFRVDEESRCKFFEDMNQELKCYYGQINQELQSIYLELEKELEPVCIRELRALPSKNISIIGTSGSLITRRRLSISMLRQ